MVRQLKGPIRKESKKEKRQRKFANIEGKSTALYIALPILLFTGLVLYIVFYLLQ